MLSETTVDLMDALRKSIGGRAATATEAPKKSNKKPRKAAAGQKEMLMPIAGKKPDEGARGKKAGGQTAAEIGLGPVLRIDEGSRL